MKYLNNKKIFFIICVFLAIVLLSFLVMSGNSLSIENWFYYEVTEYMNPTLTRIQKIITNIGSAVFVIAFCLVLICIKKTRKKVGVIASLTVMVAQFFNVILKNIFERQRPIINRLVYESGFSFPSGHSMVNAALYTMLIIIIYKNMKNKGLKIAMISLCALVPILIGISRIYLGVHYLVDVLVGWLLGVLVAVIIDVIVEKYYDKKIKKIKSSD